MNQGWNNHEKNGVFKVAVRHAEKRRISTCQFADRIAQCCVEHYQKHVPSTFRDAQKQTCLAAIVAFDRNGSVASDDNFSGNDNKGRLHVLGMGVGTKFLSQALLNTELRANQSDPTGVGTKYGRRVRDCHAEILARRAFQRELLLEIMEDLKSRCHDGPLTGADKTSLSVVERTTNSEGKLSYQLKSGMSLHMYTSSAPCGNATVRIRQLS